MDEVAVTIIGAGVVGLAVAAELSSHYGDIAVFDRNDSFGKETSSRNSEVIHSGIYYPEGSLKARLCIEGADRLYGICERYAVPNRRTGKLIIATEASELPAIERLHAQGRKNGVQNLRLLDRSEVRGIEPNALAEAALHSPNTGIIDSHALMKHFYNKAKSRDVLFSFRSDVNALDIDGHGFVIGLQGDEYRFRSRIVINCAGLAADRVAAFTGMDIDGSGYRIKLCKGSYFSYTRPSPVHTLVYPVPHEHLTGLGVHATLDLGGRLRFGPDAEYVEHIDYHVDESKKESFFRGAAKIISGIERDFLVPEMSGIRPKLSGANEPARDFVIADETDKGLSGLINLIGIESPGLTASPAIARMVAGMVAAYLN